MSYFAPCACGGSVRVESRADLRVCAACDRGNRFFILILAMKVHDFDIKASEVLVNMSGYETELLGDRGKEAQKCRGAGARTGERT